MIAEVWGAAWSPDLQICVVATADQLIAMSRDFSTISEVELAPNHAGKGWSLAVRASSFRISMIPMLSCAFRGAANHRLGLQADPVPRDGREGGQGARGHGPTLHGTHPARLRATSDAGEVASRRSNLRRFLCGKSGQRKDLDLCPEDPHLEPGHGVSFALRTAGRHRTRAFGHVSQIN